MNPKWNNVHDELEPEESGPDYELEDWDTLVDTVCEIYREPRNRVISRSHRHRYTTPRNIIAAIWSETHTLQSTALRCHWKAHKNVFCARDRMSTLMQDTIHGQRIKRILTRLSRKAPWLIERAIAAGLAPNPDDFSEK